MKKLLYLSEIFLFVLLFSFYFLSCSTPPPPIEQVNIPEDFLGIVHASRTQDPKEDKLLEEMGCKWVLNTFFWHNIEPSKGVFNFDNYDKFVEHTHKQGIKIIGLLGYGNEFKYPVKKSKHYISKKEIPLFLNYVEETTRHFKGKVDVWCVWNEPNLSSWPGTRSEYINLTKLTIKKIRETDPDAYIIGGAFWRSPRGYINKMHKNGLLDELDGFAFHPYGFGPSDCVNVHDKLINIFKEINYTGPVWITEDPTGGLYPNKISLEKLPVFIVKEITGFAARGARALLWYEIFDRVETGKTSLNSEKHFGLLNNDLSRKDGSWAYE